MITWKDVESHWPQFEPKIRNQWNKLTPADLTRVHGDRSLLQKQLETHYHITSVDAKKQVEDFLKTQPAIATKK